MFSTENTYRGGQTMLPLPWKELIPSTLSGQWLSSDVMGWGVKLWMKKHSVDDADYSSLLPPEQLLSGGISHQRDEDWITRRGKISRLQAWYHHLDYGLDLGFPNFLKLMIPHLSWYIWTENCRCKGFVLPAVINLCFCSPNQRFIQSGQHKSPFQFQSRDCR